MHRTMSPSEFRPHKSIAGALLFSVILGPVGLLYASFWGGVTMIMLGVIFVSMRFFFICFMIWVLSCVWAVGAAERYNNKMFKQIMKP